MTRTPRLRPDIVIVEQVYRGQLSYVVKDLETHNYFRFRSLEVTVMRMLNGERTCGEAAALLREDGINVSEAVVEGFAQKLNRMGLLERSLAERSTLQLERLRAERNRRARPKLFKGELLRMRWSMGDPNAAFDRWLPRLAFVFTRGFVFASVALFAINIMLMLFNWNRFHTSFALLASGASLSVGSGIAFWFTLFGIVYVHELGHGLTCKYFGGEVHEMGFMLVYFQPAFYANVTDAWTFPDLSARLWVTAAGAWIGMILSTLAGIVWWVAEPGSMISQISLLAFFFGGLFSVLTNANPLMPLDGYFALSDYLEVPNLRHRAFGHIDWLVRRHLLRLEMPMPMASERERRIFLIYGLCAIAYLTLALSIAARFVIRRMAWAFGPVGVAIALLAILLLLRGPLRSWGAAAAQSVREHRATLFSTRARRWSGAALVSLLLVVTLVPWSITVTGPFRTAPARALPVIAADTGFISRVLVREGTMVAAGTPLVRVRDFGLEERVLQDGRAADSLSLLESRARARGDAGEAERLARERTAAEITADASRQRVAALALRAPHAGVVLTSRPERLTGQWVEAGQTVLMLGEPDSVEVRILVKGSGATLVAAGQEVRMLPLSDVGYPIRATIMSVSPVTANGGIEARVRLPALPAWRPGASGEASVRIRRSNIVGALVWAVRKRIRTDILL